MPLGTRVWSLGKLLVLIGALAATFLLFAGVAMRVALRAREVEVPPLVGRTVNEASQALADLGLALRIDPNQRSDEKIAAGRIMQQDPPASARAPRVSLLLNRGEQATTYVMPDIIGMNGDRAADALRSRGFRVSIVGSLPYPGVPTGTVVRQQPAGGFQVGPGDAISIEVSR